MGRIHAGVVFVAALMLVGCNSGPPSPLPSDPDELIIYSLDVPEIGNEDELARAKSKGEVLYSFPVLGKVRVTEPAKIREVLRSVRRAIANPPSPKNCFSPRHAVRTVKDGEIVDLVICFECNTYFIFRGVEPKGGRLTPAIGSEPEALLDQVLSDAGVPLAPKPQ
jgi:hypothetical protein